MLINCVIEHMYIKISKAKHNGTLMHVLYQLKDFLNACRLDGNFHDDGFLAYAGDNISFDIEIFDQ